MPTLKKRKNQIEKMLSGEVELDPLARKLVEKMSELDWELLDGSVDIKMGGDGDMGEFLVVLLHLALKDEGII